MANTLSSPSTAALLIVILVLLSVNIWRQTQYLNGITSYDSRVVVSDNTDIEQLKRYSKYFQNYRYIPPATRYKDISPLPAKECGKGPDFEPWWNLNGKERSRFSEDRFIYETFFKNVDDNFKGTYLELGAYNGRDESNTRFFDDCLGWKGLLLEGNPVIFRQTIENRPYAHKMSMAPSCTAAFEAENKTIQFYRVRWTNAGLVGHANAFEGRPTVDVPCAPLQPILEDMFRDEANRTIGNIPASGLPTLDFFSLDVEGSENLVLSTIDFQKVRINVMIIEIWNNFCQKECESREQIRAKMQAEGYKRYENLVRSSDLYVHPESPFQVPKWVLDAKNSGAGGTVIVPKEKQI